MRDLMGMLGKAKEMQAKFQAMQEEIANIEIEGLAAAGAVKVTLSGKFEMRKLSVDPSLLKADEAEILEDLILAAHNDARVKIESEMQRKTQEMTAGLPIPPGFKLPF
ncbi:nucleoid-associated protein [Nitratireductor aestuarii]|uniref:Nucleoid-associated protein GCM10011385_11510 n=1 Tax=Nitratireductor aestuarii TaxID=1735103 RepID=A0A916RK36_9HYPH|nr:YbaB/EbfC family nucleoid-associated protein [Nitratireductor aestuarii]GGA59472.1 nucleoid-associated protein [Nitratireductor aestuarii]